MGPMVPPMAPGVAAQMQPSPVEQYVGGIMGAPQNPAEAFNPSQFALMRLSEAATALQDVAKALQLFAPGMLGPLKIMFEAGATLMSELEASMVAAGPAPGGGELPPAEAQPRTGIQSLSMG